MIVVEGFPTITSNMNNEDPDELVCWWESEEGGSLVSSADAELQKIESVRADATNCNGISPAVQGHQAAACFSCDTSCTAVALSSPLSNAQMVFTRIQSAERE